MITLRGITWDHPRGYQGLEAATAAFMRLRPDIRVEWDRHSLHHFEFHPVAALAARYDLMVIDHPSMGDVASAGCLLDLEPHRAVLEVDRWADDVAGRSLASYRYGGALWALPIDAACQTAVYRPDLLGQRPVPRTLAGVRELASEATIAIAFKDVHALMTFFTLCANLGAPPFDEGQSDELVAPSGGCPLGAVAVQALETLREILGWCPPEVLAWSSIDALDAMSRRSDLVYCPYIFSYSSYSAPVRDGHRVRFVDMPGVADEGVAGSVLGGTGFAISRACRAPQAALALAAFLMHGEVQKGMALQHGQPARRSTWLDETVNQAYLEFYRGTLKTLDAAYLRPRHAGYLRFQWEGGQIVERFLREGGNPRLVVQELNQAYRVR